VEKLIQGIHHFRDVVFGPNHALFEQLARQDQRPQALFVTCSDSRVQPDVLLGCDPGDVFILRNAGNLLPPHGASAGGEAATVEYALTGLGIRDVIVCGHSCCGAMLALLAPERLAGMPTMARWLTHADATRAIMSGKYRHLAGAQLLTATVEENVLVQLENLRTHHAVAAGLAACRVRLHGWVYKIETGRVFHYDPAEGQFVPLPRPPSARTPTGVPDPLRQCPPVSPATP
jgi:carbonic anhydrase